MKMFRLITCILSARGATTGNLTLNIVGGSKSEFDKDKPLLDLIRKNMIHCGENGVRQVFMYLYMHMLAVCGCNYSSTSVERPSVRMYGAL